MSKTRSDAVLAGLPEEKQQQIEEAVRPLSIRNGVAHLAAEWDIVISKTTLSDWLNERQARREAEASRDRIRKATFQANLLTEDLADDAEDKMDRAVKAATAEWLMDYQIKGGDPREVAELIKLLTQDRALRQRDRDLALKTRRLELIEKKAAVLDALTRKVEGGNAITPETLAEMQRQAGLL